MKKGDRVKYSGDDKEYIVVSPDVAFKWWFIVDKDGTSVKVPESELTGISEGPSINFKIEVDMGTVCDLIVTVIEDSTWCEIPQEVVAQIKTMFPKEPEVGFTGAQQVLSWGEKVAKAAMEKGVNVPVIESDEFDETPSKEVIGYIRPDTIKRGFSLLAKWYPETLSRILTEDWDIDDADILIQLSLFGEIVYS